VSEIGYVVLDSSGVYHCRDVGRSTGTTLCGEVFMLRDTPYDVAPAGLELCPQCKRVLDEREAGIRRKGMIR